jgi:hypothetical protein
VHASAPRHPPAVAILSARAAPHVDASLASADVKLVSASALSPRPLHPPAVATPSARAALPAHASLVIVSVASPAAPSADARLVSASAPNPRMLLLASRMETS